MIYFERNTDTKTLLDLFIQNGGFFNKNLSIKYNNNEFGIFSNNKITSLEEIISVPKNLYINKKEFCEYINNEPNKSSYDNILSNYSSSLPDYSHFEKHHPLLISNQNKEIILSLIKENSSLHKNIFKKFKDFDNLENKVNKYVYLIFKTRSFFSKINNQEYLLPILDFLNYNYFESGYHENIESFYIRNLNELEVNDEVFQSYNTKLNPIIFFFNFGFYPLNYRSFVINKNEITFNSNNKDIKFENSGFMKKIENNLYSNIVQLEFEYLNIPNEFSKLQNVFENNYSSYKFFSDILKTYSESFNLKKIQEIDNNLEKYDLIIIDFCKCIKSYLSNINHIKTSFLKIFLDK